MTEQPDLEHLAAQVHAIAENRVWPSGLAAACTVPCPYELCKAEPAMPCTTRGGKNRDTNKKRQRPPHEIRAQVADREYVRLLGDRNPFEHRPVPTLIEAWERGDL